MSGIGSTSPSGGLFPGQQSLANFNLGQGEIGNAQAVSQRGMGPSTATTQMDAGTQMNQALQEQQMSLADSIAFTNYSNEANQLQQQNLQSKIGGAGSLLGSFGGTGL